MAEKASRSFQSQPDTPSTENDPCFHPRASSVKPSSSRSITLRLGGVARALGETCLESVLELAGDGAEVSDAAGAGDLPALGLLGPVVCFLVSEFSSSIWAVWHARLLSTRQGIDRARKLRLVGQRTLANLSSRVSARRAGVLLVVHGAASDDCRDRVSLWFLSSPSFCEFLLPNLDRPNQRSSSLRDQTYPHRRQMPCVLVWLQRNISTGETVRITRNLQHTACQSWRYP